MTILTTHPFNPDNNNIFTLSLVTYKQKHHQAGQYSPEVIVSEPLLK